LTQCYETKVVIVGQDPYPAKGQADGLAFSVRCDCPKVPDSLKNIRTELRDDGWHAPEHGSLEAWARRGVLPLHVTLTVRDGVRQESRRCRVPTAIASPTDLLSLMPFAGEERRVGGEARIPHWGVHFVAAEHLCSE